MDGVSTVQESLHQESISLNFNETNLLKQQLFALCAQNHVHECASNLVLTVINLTLLLVVSAFGVVAASLYRKPSGSSLFPLHSLRWNLFLVLFLLYLMNTLDSILHMSYEYLRPQHSVHLVLNSGSSLVAIIAVAFFYSYCEEKFLWEGLSILTVYWPLSAAGHSFKAYALYEKGASIQHLCLEYTYASIALSLICCALEIYVFVTQWAESKKTGHHERLRSEESDATYRYSLAPLLSQVTFAWVLPLLRKGFNHPLTQTDLGFATEEHSNETQYSRFNENLLGEFDELKKIDSKTRINLWKVYVKTYWRRYLFAILLKIFGDILALVGPLSIKKIIQFIESEREGAQEHKILTFFDLLNNGYVLAIGVLISTLLQSTLSNNFQHIVTMQGIYIQSALRTAVYRKTLSLRLKQDDQDEETEETDNQKDRKAPASIGSIVNHMSTDCAQVMLIFTNFHYIWMLPLKVGLTLYLIYDVLGVSALLSSSLLIAVTPIQYLISRAMSKIQTKTMIISDERIKKTTELIQGVKLLKILGWEELFVRKIQQIRNIERKLLRKDAIFVAMNTFLTMFSSVLVPLACFALYTYLGGSPLEAGVIFEALSLFNHLTLPLFIVPFAIPVVISSMVSTRRLEEFLSKPEIESETPWSDSPQKAQRYRTDINGKDSESNSFLRVTDGTLEWNKGVEVLRELNFNVPLERLTMIAGPCGTGKTTLLSALLGELELARGTITYHVKQANFVAYVPQKPWLVNASVRDNILFGRPHESKWYRKVLEACALNADLETLPASDRTEIGERGANLSGGQRQRIAIARAIYSKATFFLLDDPLSALDAHVAHSVFENAIQKLLVNEHKTVVMVTQKKDLLCHAHKLLILNERAIIAKGTYEDVRKNHPESLELLESDSGVLFKAPMNRPRNRSKCRASFSESMERNLEKVYSITRRMSEIGQSPSIHDGCGEMCANESHHPFVSERRSSILSERGMQLRSVGGLLEGSISPCRSRTHTGASIVTFCEKEPYRMGSLEINDLGNPSTEFTASNSWKLVETEDRCEGSISGKVYLSYAKACGLFAVILSVAFFTIMQFCKMASDFWLSQWSHHNREASGSLGHSSNWYYLFIYAAISVANVLFAFIANLSAQLTTISATKPLHDRMLERVVACPQSFFDQNPVGRIINRFSGDMNIVDRKLPIGSPVLIRFILICFSVVLVNVIVTPLSIIFIGISFAVYWYLQYFFRASSRELQRLECITRSPIVSHFSETLNGLHTIRAFDRQGDFVLQLHSLINSNNIAVIMLNSANCWLGVSLDYMGAVILFLVIMVNIVAALTGYITPAAVGLTMTYTLLVPQYLNWVVKNLALVEMYMSSVERIMNYIGLTGEKTMRCLTYDPKINDNQVWPQEGIVEFENISLKYDTSSQPVLNDVNIVIKSNEKVGICGRSGSGKSSLVMGLFQMVPLTRGRILIDGIDLANEDAHEVRSKLSMIPQDPILFEGTVRYNLDPIGRHTEEELWIALEKAHIKEIVIEAGGLDAEITEEGSNLSSGEKQLFCLARSILSPSRVLVLDEATSSLDVSLEEKMLEIINDVWKNSTVIAIAHRVTSIENFDRVIVLDQGSIVEDGDPRILKENPNSQFGSLLRSYKQEQSHS